MQTDKPLNSTAGRDVKTGRFQQGNGIARGGAREGEGRKLDISPVELQKKLLKVIQRGLHSKSEAMRLKWAIQAKAFLELNQTAKFNRKVRRLSVQ